ncbi:gluconate 2-dehydrogenase subunit 3 family protein [Segetibacter sp.]|uniref:gluconate 2-dehydrogenase subunit 3 family protein n=1 Tax=Segetibacter sp. TaxID=2231182 RepID=UPI002610188C|nr:gluconate 2-dehydrogenase subunit 3 family protein [Segetibacter sp.]MCW3082089.1 gluconate 2-dehydrogenase subunit 3 family protein [Segetibacter sp.]
MNRREAVQHISLLLGGSIVGAAAFLNGCSTDGDSNRKVNFSTGDVDFLDEVGETILPATNTPGAKAAKVGQHMKVMVNDCYEERDQIIFYDGIKDLKARAKKELGDDFMDLKPEQRLALLTKMDNETTEFMKTWEEPHPKPYFRLMKELTLLGFFTSEVGCTQARRYIETPGRYEACVPYKKGDKTWA